MYSALLFFILRYHLHQRLPGNLQDLTHGDYAAVMGRTTLQDLREVPSLQDLLGLKSVIVTSEREEEVLRTLDRCTLREGAGSHPLFFGLISQDALLHLTQRAIGLERITSYRKTFWSSSWPFICRSTRIWPATWTTSSCPFDPLAWCTTGRAKWLASGTSAVGSCTGRSASDSRICGRSTS